MNVISMYVFVLYRCKFLNFFFFKIFKIFDLVILQINQEHRKAQKFQMVYNNYLAPDGRKQRILGDKGTYVTLNNNQF